MKNLLTILIFLIGIQTVSPQSSCSTTDNILQNESNSSASDFHIGQSFKANCDNVKEIAFWTTQTTGTDLTVDFKIYENIPQSGDTEIYSSEITIVHSTTPIENVVDLSGASLSISANSVYTFVISYLVSGIINFETSNNNPYNEGVHIRRDFTNYQVISGTDLKFQVFHTYVDSNPFITQWTVDNSDLEITIPVHSNPTYNYSVDWGDGNIEYGLTESKNHTYLSAGTYTVKISGLFPRILFNGIDGADEIVSVDAWGDNLWISMKNAFKGCQNLEINATDNPNLTQVTNMDSMFLFCESFVGDSTPMEDWDTSTITNMRDVFHNCTNFNGNVEDWDVSSVTDMDKMFDGALAFNQNLGNWDISSVTYMNGMFTGVTLSTDNYDNTLIGWATLDLDSGETQIPTGITFNGGDSKYCFSEQSRALLITPIDQNGYGWTISDGDKDPDCESTFFITTWQTDDGEIEIPTVLNNDRYLVDWDYDGTIFVPESDENGNPLYYTGKATKTNITSIDSFQVAITGDFRRISVIDFSTPDHSNAEKLMTIDQWGDIEWKSMKDAFRSAINLKVLAQDILNLANVTNMEGMFMECESFVGDSTPMEDWDTSTVTNMWNVFRDCPNFNGNVQDWVVSSVTNMNSMFEGATQFNGDISGWNVSSVTDMEEMFVDAEAFNQDIGDWNVSAVDDMYQMFDGALAFNQNLGNWDISSVTYMNGMFTGVTLSTDNYDNTLIGWATLDLDSGETQIPTGITFDGGDSKYCFSEQSRALLITPIDQNGYGWTISDGDKDPDCESTFFITTWQTDDGEIEIPTVLNNDRYLVDWDYDGTIFVPESDENGNPLYYTGKATKTNITSIDSFQVAITGDFRRISVIDFSTPDHSNGEKLKSIDQWGDIEWESMEDAFRSAINLKVMAQDILNLANVTNMDGMFMECESFEGDSTPMEDWDTSTVTNMLNVFRDCPNFNGNVQDWVVSSVTEMKSMFAGATQFNGDISGWNVSSVTDMKEMFEGAEAFNQDIGDWNVSAVDDMQQMFNGALAFNQNLGNWDISSVTNMYGMFTGVTLSTDNYDNTLIGWATLDLDSGETQIPTGINFDGGDSKYCFSEQSRALLITPIDQNGYGWTISDGDKDPDCESTFFITTWQTDDGEIEIPTVLNNDRYLVDWDYDGTIFVPESDENGNPLYYTGKATKTNITSIDSFQVAITGDFRRISVIDFSTPDHSNGEKLKSIDQWGDIEWESMEDAFRSAINLKVLAQDILNLANVTNMDGMFSECESFVGDSTPLEDWDTSTVTNMWNVFRDCPNFNGNVQDWVVSSVTNMNSMFAGATQFNGDISGWNVSSVTDMEEMFEGAEAFNQDIGDWNVSAVDDMYQMFDGALAFNQNLGNWDISSVTYMNGMFTGVTLSTDNYDNTLIGWATLDLDSGETQIPTGITFDGGDSKYCFSEQSRALLITPIDQNGYGWTISDGGIDCSTVDPYDFTLIKNGDLSYTIAAVAGFDSAAFNTITESYGFTILLPDGITIDVDNSSPPIGEISMDTAEGTDLIAYDATMSEKDLTLVIASTNGHIIPTHAAGEVIPLVTFNVIGDPTSGEIRLLSNTSVLATSYPEDVFNAYFIADIQNDDNISFQNVFNALTANEAFTFICNVIPEAGTSQGPITICANNELLKADLEANLLDADAGGDWTDSNGDPIEFPLNVAGTYTYTVVGMGVCSGEEDSEEVIINVDALPEAGTSSGATFCAGTVIDQIDLESSLTGSDPGGSWTDSENNPVTFPISIAGNYTYTVTGIGPCDQLSDNETVTVNFTPLPEAGTGSEATLCSGTVIDQIDLESSLTGSDPGGSWTDSENNPVTFPISIAGNYTYTVIGTGTCSQYTDTAIVTINFIPLPEAGTSSGATFCAGTVIDQIDLESSLTGSDPGGSWTDSENNPVTFPISIAGNYTYTVTGIGPCNQLSDAATVPVNFIPLPEAGTSSGATFCAGTVIDQIDLESSLTGSDPGGSWTDSDNNPVTFPISIAGNYTYTVLGIGPCSQLSDAVTVPVNFIPLPEAGTSQGSITICANDEILQVDLEANLLGADAGGDWTDSNGDPLIFPISTEGEFIYTVTGSGSCSTYDDSETVIVIYECSILLAPKVFLQGAIINPTNPNESHLMRDDLRAAGYLPTDSPYGDGLTTESGVFQITGDNAIVDWIFVELRDGNDNTNIIESQSALLQRDGDIVSMDGTSELGFNAASGVFYVAIKHRNHLGIMSNATFTLGSVSTPVDFTIGTDVPTYGTYAQATLITPENTNAMWLGDANGDGIVQYTGGITDSAPILAYVLNDDGNQNEWPTYVVNGYANTDVNMNGFTQYSGSNPELSFILQNVLNYPLNTLQFSTWPINEQFPGSLNRFMNRRTQFENSKN